MASLFVSVASALSSSPLNPLPAVGRRVFTALLGKLRIGRVTLVVAYEQPAPAVCEFGEEAGADAAGEEPRPESVYHGLRATVTVTDAALWQRLVLSGDMGFAEAYMAGEVDVDNMMAFLMIMVKNKPYLEPADPTSVTAWAGATLDYLAHTKVANSLKNALNNISAHYDLSNDMFAAFLDSRMQYSCAVWDWATLDKDTLEAAQLRKITKLITKAKLTPTSKLLEIGSGWGGLAVEAVRQSGGCEVITITLSVEQKVLAEERIRAAEASGYIPAGRIQVLLCDYRKLPERFPAGHFDSIISCEMIEAVGKEYLGQYFEVCHQMLHPTNGVMVLQAITMPETRAESYAKKADFIQKYIFPGGYLATVTQIASHAALASNNQLLVDDAESFAAHYARTLQVWRHKFVRSYPALAKAADLAASPTVATNAHDVARASDAAYATVDEIEGVKRRGAIGTPEFERKFLYYFDYCAAGFATRVIDVFQFVLTREGCERMLVGPYARGDIAYVPAAGDE